MAKGSKRPKGKKADLLLYSVFHLNIMFSSIEENMRPAVIKRCYWPLLRLGKKFPGAIAIEATGYTLEVVGALDPSWIQELRSLIEEGTVEFVGSGYAQIIGPLVPAVVTQHNLEIGFDIYQKLLNVRPRVAYLNEQTYSSGMVDLYLEAGFEALITEWDNAAMFHASWDKEMKYDVVRARGTSATTLPIVWNNSMAFQQFQRYAHGETTLSEYRRYIGSHQKEGGERILSLYGSDAEVFDFRPGRFTTEAPLGAESEWKRITALYQLLSEDEDVCFITPSVALDRIGAGKTVRELSLETSEQPIIVKKQGRYNVTRWAVTGRDSISTNTICYRICEALQSIETPSPQLWRELCYAWSSDFRTHITLARYKAYRTFLSSLLARALHKSKNHGAAKQAAIVVKRARVMRDENIIIVDTTQAVIALDTRRGLSIRSLLLPNLSKTPLIGTLPHGYYEDIGLGADFHSGSTSIELPGEHCIEDLERVSDLSIKKDRTGTARIEGTIPTRLGKIKKTITVDSAAGRIVLEYQFDLKVKKPASFRTGILTLNPRAFDPRTLYYQCHNGGPNAERFSLSESARVDIEPVSLLVSASGSLGNTTGTFAIGDARKQLRLVTPMSTLAAVPMLQFTKVRDSFLLRLFYSLAEFDDSTVLSRGEILPRFKFRLELWAT